ncbi:glutamate-1-semialdehyde 2,1-aminomutase [Paraburkholderia acidisoli]|uniref:Glutamate-1-semialdehyde 2,1-aminomutase n=1 Tax=Paraburkholderia acidisoli TaxID=2571748 RepID=A0A7Z2GHX5_9BURK|nr:glutamate-1-semialdehyde 2,1-aminomutase [Paraburkholderia acidisoli]QGZ62081.1 glutamate-1-semialdehyde 2,1-aminomutase [Paraburkholderia acidisoli]
MSDTTTSQATTTSRNAALFERAQRTIPGGVNSPVRAFRSVGGTPRFIERAQGPYFWDAEGKRYIDYIGSWGPMIVGHVHPDVLEAVQRVLANGFSFGAPTEAEIEIAEEICKIVPSMEQVRMVSSGTEATMSALRLARGFTKRDRIVKFEGCYHGHADSLLVKAGSGLLTFGNPTSAGVPVDVAKHTTVLEYNNVAALEEAFKAFGDEIAAVIVEPVAGNMNLVKATPEFIGALRSLTAKHGSVLIFDEVMCGFRVGLRGAQALYGVEADLVCLGKVIGGGMPAAAFGGRREIMDHLAPNGTVYQAGTLSGNPIAVAAGLKTLQLIQAPGFYEQLTLKTERLVKGMTAAAREAKVPFAADSVGGMFGLYFADNVPGSFAEVTKSDVARFNRFFHAMLDAGVYFAPSAYEAGFVSSVHSDALLDETIEAARRAFAAEAAAENVKQ